jgi:elongation factor G
MLVEVLTPDVSAGAVMDDLSSRRGLIEDMQQRTGLQQIIKAFAPLAEMLGYAAHLRSIVHGRTDCSLQFARYDVPPPSEDSGADEAGVTANKPKGPKAGSSYAAASFDPEPE